MNLSVSRGSQDIDIGVTRYWPCAVLEPPHPGDVSVTDMYAYLCMYTG